MRRTGRTLRRRKECRCKVRDIRTWGSFTPGRGWRGGFTASSCTVLAASEKCSSTPAAAREPGDLRCGWDPARRLCSFNLSEMKDRACGMTTQTPSAAEEVNQQFGDTGGLFVLKPMRGIGEGKELRVRAVTQAFARHFGHEEGVALAPQDARGDAHGLVWEFDACAEQGAVPVDHAGEGTALRPRGAILRQIFGGESARAA